MYISNHNHSLLGRIWICWDSSMVQFFGKVQLNDNFEFFTSFIYADCDAKQRRSRWKSLIRQASITKGFPWLILGDFNVTSKAREHSRRSSVSKVLINSIEVEDIRSMGFNYTWNNKRAGSEAVAKTLDRVIGNWDWFNKYGDSHCTYLSPGISDHCPSVV
ncbi:Exo_endo_phos domain-containing protein [Cephalotus follicularis]|uniref:Exo_endo_phos domain-containing protein n=1 Tax=Cephalotus follicularis TaxID=3775 RepID=A0A1Q3ANM1_CEPFO|nr:Exo_endo_phos domain-containing protein [Cephalotus follicularis]